MTIAGIRKRSIFLKTRLSTLGSIDLASSPIKSIVGVVLLNTSFVDLELSAVSPLSRPGDVVMVKI